METIEKIERRITQIECFNCRYEFEIGHHDIEKECPLCGALNRIPFP
jgi:Zn finger protein HypA/HybF involved in hydrogenase expression